MKTPLQQIAHNHILEMIYNDELQFDMIYSETKIAKHLNISRTPVRDAVHKLEQEGYINIIPSKGFELHKYTIREIEEIYETRSAIECYCTSSISSRNEEKEVLELFTKLDLIVERQREVLETTKNISEFLEYDFKFHKTLINFFNNSVFESIYTTFIYKFKTLAKQSLAHEGRMTKALEEHENILNAMKSGNINEINAITLVHMDTTKALSIDDIK